MYIKWDTRFIGWWGHQGDFWGVKGWDRVRGTRTPCSQLGLWAGKRLLGPYQGIFCGNSTHDLGLGQPSFMNYNWIYIFHPKKGQFLPLHFLRPPILWHVRYGCILFSLKLPTALKWIRWFHNPTVFSLKMNLKKKKKRSSGNSQPGVALMVCKKLNLKVTFLRNITEWRQKPKNKISMGNSILMRCSNKRTNKASQQSWGI